MEISCVKRERPGRRINLSCFIMKTIIAATDMSVKSRPSLRFAMRLAETMNAKLHIVHVHYVLRASMWSDEQYSFYQNKASDILSKELDAFADKVLRTDTDRKISVKTVLYQHPDTSAGILEYAELNKGSYICIGTQGAGFFGRLIGSNATKLIRRSEIPVLGIPASYRMRNLSNILYLTDVVDSKAELQQVVNFARPVQAAVTMLHLYHPYELVPNKKLMQLSLCRSVNYPVALEYMPRNPNTGLSGDIEAAQSDFKPSLLVLFTNQDRDLLDRLISPSTTRDMSFISKVPLLSFPKREMHAETHKFATRPGAFTGSRLAI